MRSRAAGPARPVLFPPPPGILAPQGSPGKRGGTLSASGAARKSQPLTLTLRAPLLGDTYCSAATTD